MENFSHEALEAYRSRAKLVEVVDSPEFTKRLLQQGLLKELNGQVTPSGFGILLFSKEPRDVLPQAGLLSTIKYPDGSLETNDFDGPMVLIPTLLQRWLESKLPSIIDRSHMQRQTLPPLPSELVREAVVNALVHRDYDIEGAKCQLLVTQDTITVRSPGAPLAPVTLEKLQSFKAPMLSRNPALHYVFARMGLAEERGLGMNTFRTVPERHGLPLPKYAYEDPYLDLTLYRSSLSVLRALAPELLETFNKDERKGWEFLASKVETTKSQYAEQLGFDDRKAQRHLKKFVDLGLLRRVGSGPSTRYQVVRT